MILFNLRGSTQTHVASASSSNLIICPSHRSFPPLTGKNDEEMFRRKNRTSVLIQKLKLKRLSEVDFFFRSKNLIRLYCRQPTDSRASTTTSRHFCHFNAVTSLFCWIYKNIEIIFLPLKVFCF